MEPTQVEEVYGAGHARLDRDHEILLALLAKISGPTDAPRPNTDAVITELCAYMDAHFENEEQFMDLYQDPDANKHKAEHRDLRLRAAELSKLFCDAPETVATIARLMQDTIESHMCGIDRSFAEFLKVHVESVANGPGGVFEE